MRRTRRLTLFSAALEHGVPALPASVPVGTGLWGDFGSVVVLRHDEEDDHDLVDDVYRPLTESDRRDRWPAPSLWAALG
ncbi:hypothetical protein AB0F81_09345 [Actinoplanes sp. NPDC024001]|uniref:hypothetical protein n=1 Tax=Actinoplanes sp. NPDC024001 TaxID=3154598 RepID=UPI003401DC5C